MQPPKSNPPQHQVQWKLPDVSPLGRGPSKSSGITPGRGCAPLSFPRQKLCTAIKYKQTPNFIILHRIPGGWACSSIFSCCTRCCRQRWNWMSQMIGLALTQLKGGGNPNILPWPWESENFLLISRETKKIKKSVISLLSDSSINYSTLRYCTKHREGELKDLNNLIFQSCQ